VARRELPPPAVVYELTESGLGLEPLVYELARFGVRFMGPFDFGVVAPGSEPIRPGSSPTH